MIEMLNRYDKRIAAGVLARAALALESGENWLTAKPVVENEPALRAALIHEARAKLGIKPGDRGPEVIDRIGSYFDEESERLLGQPHTTSAFERLIARGDFPSDLYDIRIIPSIKEFFAKDFDREKAFIERTVRAPMNEQHFGPPTVDKAQPFLISLFARQFRTPFPFKDFTMLVAGNRGEGRAFHVHQAWRLYASKVDVTGSAELIELLRRFASVYGYDIDLDGRRGSFFLTAEKPAPPKIAIQVGGKTRMVTITQFLQIDPATGTRRAALVVAIDLDLYRETVVRMDCKEIAEQQVVSH